MKFKKRMRKKIAKKTILKPSVSNKSVSLVFKSFLPFKAEVS